MSAPSGFEPSDLAAIEAAIRELMSRARPLSLVKSEDPRPELDPEEHAGRELSPADWAKRADLIARNRALNHPFRF